MNEEPREVTVMFGNEPQSYREGVEGVTKIWTPATPDRNLIVYKGDKKIVFSTNTQYMILDKATPQAEQKTSTTY